jgi:hypothetical protein
MGQRAQAGLGQVRVFEPPPTALSFDCELPRPIDHELADVGRREVASERRKIVLKDGCVRGHLYPVLKDRPSDKSAIAKFAAM